MEVFEEVREVAVGTPEQVMEPMALPLSMVSGTWWKDDGVLAEVSKEMLKLFAEEAHEGLVTMKFPAILGIGRKSE